MTMTRSTQRLLIAAFFTILIAVYGVAWLAPGVGLFRDDALYLVTAKSLATGHGFTIQSLPVPTPATGFPPLFPALLALFLMISEQTQWIKLLPLLCTAGWLALTWKLMRKTGASTLGALLLILITAASPTTIFLGTNFFPDSLFALLCAAALLALLDDRGLPAGAFAGLAALTWTAGLALIPACILTFLVRGKLRSAIVFSGASVLMVAPWLGWALAHSPSDYAALTVFTSLPPNEKLVVIAGNLLALLASPFELLTGIDSLYAATVTAVLIVWSIIRRRQFVPDVFLAAYCIALLCRVRSLQSSLTPVLPLILWLFWRAFHKVRYREALSAVILIVLSLTLFADFRRLPDTLLLGQFAPSGKLPSDWKQMRILFTYLRQNTPDDAILMADLDPLFYLSAGRKTIRGFTPDLFLSFYARSARLVRPEQLLASIRNNDVTYAIVTPDREIVESGDYRGAVEALERAGILQPVAVPGLAHDYRVLKRWP